MTTFALRYDLDEPLPGLAGLTGELPWLDVDLPGTDQAERLSAINLALSDAVAAAERPVTVLTGDCVSSLGVLSGLQRAGLDPSVVWFDGHGDFNTREISETGYVGGMPVAAIVGRDDLGLTLPLTPIPEERILLCARDLDPAEAAALAASGIRQHSVSEVDSTTIPAGPLYLHVDLDVLDPSELDGLVYPTPNGPTVAELAAALGRVLDTGRVVAVNVVCTLRRDRLGSNAAGELLPRLGLRP